MATGKKVKLKTTAMPKNKPARSTAPKAAKPAAPDTPGQTGGLGDPGEDRIAEFLKLSAREMAFHLLRHPEEWLDWPNPKFGGEKPNDLIANGQEERVKSLLAAGALGMF